MSEDSLDVVAKRLDVGTYLLMGKGEEHSGGRNKKALLADCVEALFAACYIDSGIEPARSFILKFMIPQIEAVVRNNYHHDFKTSLQEYCQHCYKKTPVYTLVDKKGPEHDFIFFVTVDVHGQAFGPAQGSTKNRLNKMPQSLPTKDWTSRRSKPLPSDFSLGKEAVLFRSVTDLRLRGQAGTRAFPSPVGLWERQWRGCRCRPRTDP